MSHVHAHGSSRWPPRVHRGRGAREIARASHGSLRAGSCDRRWSLELALTLPCHWDVCWAPHSHGGSCSQGRGREVVWI